jgi:hypothetical protein
MTDKSVAANKGATTPRLPIDKVEVISVLRPKKSLKIPTRQSENKSKKDRQHKDRKKGEKDKQ